MWGRNLIIMVLLIISISFVFAYESSIDRGSLGFVKPSANDIFCNVTDSECQDDPSDSCDVRDKDFILTQDYDFPNGITICNSDRVVDCQGFQLRGIDQLWSVGINAYWVDNVEIINCDITLYHKGITYASVNNSKITKSTIHDSTINDEFREAIMIVGGQQNTIQWSTIRNYYGRGINLWDTVGNTLQFNIIKDNDFDGIIFFGANETIVFANNVSNNRWGLNSINSVPTSNFNIFTKNRFSGNRWEGMSIQESHNNEFINNEISNNFGSGIFLFESNDNRFEKNRAYQNNNHGIISVGSSNNYFRANAFLDNSQSGAYIDQQSHANTFLYNNFDDNSAVGLWLRNSNNEVVNFNRLCRNGVSDFIVQNSNSNTGDENTCDNPQNWKDDSTFGCTYNCSDTNAPGASGSKVIRRS